MWTRLGFHNCSSGQQGSILEQIRRFIGAGQPKLPWKVAADEALANFKDIGLDQRCPCRLWSSSSWKLSHGPAIAARRSVRTAFALLVSLIDLGRGAAYELQDECGRPRFQHARKLHVSMTHFGFLCARLVSSGNLQGHGVTCQISKGLARWRRLIRFILVTPGLTLRVRASWVQALVVVPFGVGISVESQSCGPWAA